jgi:hypothetical protein
MGELTVEMVSDGNDIFVVVDGVKVAKRGHPGTVQANTWISIEPGWRVFDHDYPAAISVEHNGVRVH